VAPAAPPLVIEKSYNYYHLWISGTKGPIINDKGYR